MSFPSWPAGTVVMLATQGDGPQLIPVSAALKAADDSVLLALAKTRGSLSRLRGDPRVAVLVLAGTDIAVTIYGRATVIDEDLGESVVAVQVSVERTANHERPTFVIEAGVVWQWTDPGAKQRDGEVRAALSRLAGF